MSDKRKIDVKYWQEIMNDPKAAKEALVGLQFDGGQRVKFVQLADGSKIPVDQVTEEQAYNFMKALCPSWAKP